MQMLHARLCSAMARDSLPTPGEFVRIGRFVLVGTAAAAVHWMMVVALVGRFGWQPLVANVAGWAAAFTVSFAGHHLLTFRGHGTAWLASARRFLLISSAGFATNEAAYAVLLRWTSGRYDVLLLIVLVMVAGATYLLSRRWAFAGAPGG
ncbi:GtrA family protein [Ramlibacter tataouinensis]|uniref:GtrA family protein n=1 Tax=Ramlibacter tataouinensis TaxID=94132 RepID=UPI0022F3F03A|nr:GtrA family protein [Ramlibacter tataouinensis]WBY02593.1 GtrA family protein [Ramlibacter tataouinensis]